MNIFILSITHFLNMCLFIYCPQKLIMQKYLSDRDFRICLPLNKCLLNENKKYLYLREVSKTLGLYKKRSLAIKGHLFITLKSIRLKSINAPRKITPLRQTTIISMQILFHLLLKANSTYNDRMLELQEKRSSQNELTIDDNCEVIHIFPNQ